MATRVLIVDDNLTVRVMLRELLSFHGHQTLEAETLNEAVSAYSSNKPDLVLLDLALAGTNGLKVLEALRQVDSAAKVIIVSANAQKKIRETMLAAGAVDFVNKPIDFDYLIKAIGRFCPP
jgi:two-component system, chemotaxis family, chemotaxis protein CheY